MFSTWENGIKVKVHFTTETALLFCSDTFPLLNVEPFLSHFVTGKTMSAEKSGHDRLPSIGSWLDSTILLHHSKLVCEFTSNIKRSESTSAIRSPHCTLSTTWVYYCCWESIWGDWIKRRRGEQMFVVCLLASPRMIGQTWASGDSHPSPNVSRHGVSYGTHASSCKHRLLSPQLGIGERKKEPTFLQTSSVLTWRNTLLDAFHYFTNQTRINKKSARTTLIVCGPVNTMDSKSGTILLCSSFSCTQGEGGGKNKQLGECKLNPLQKSKCSNGTRALEASFYKAFEDFLPCGFKGKNGTNHRLLQTLHVVEDPETNKNHPGSTYPKGFGGKGTENEGLVCWRNVCRCFDCFFWLFAWCLFLEMKKRTKHRNGSERVKHNNGNEYKHNSNNKNNNNSSNNPTKRGESQ